MKVGDAAVVTRTFRDEDVAAYVALGGARPPAGTAPELMAGALFSYLLGVRLPGPGANYLKQETRYNAPVPLNAPVTARVEIVRLRPEKALVDLATTLTDAQGGVLATGRALIQAGDTGLPFEV